MTEPAASPRGSASWLPLAAAALAAVHASFSSPSWLVPAVALGAALFALRRAPRLLAALALAAVLIEAGGHLHAALTTRGWSSRARAWVGRRVDRIEQRTAELSRAASDAAEEIAATADARGALLGDEDARSRLFNLLAARHEDTRRKFPEPMAFSVSRPGPGAVAWGGPVAASPHAEPSPEPQLSLVSGTITITLVARAPVRGLDGRVIGWSTAELPIAVRRHIRNAFLFDFDLLAESDPAVSIRYGAEPPPAAASGPSPTPEPVFEEGELLGPAQEPWGRYRIEATPLASVLRAQRRGWGAAFLSAVVLLWLAWLLDRRRARQLRVGHVLVAATALRLLFWALPIAFAGWSESLMSSAVYASSFGTSWPTEAGRVIGSLADPLMRSPVDLLLTAGCVWLAVLWLVTRAARARPWLGPPGLLLADLVSLGLLAATFVWISDLSFQSRVELDQVSLIPRRPVYAVLQLSALLVTTAGAGLIFVAQSVLARSPTSRAGVFVRIAFAGLVAAVAYRVWPREVLGLPFFPAAALFMIAALLAATRERGRRIWSEATPGLRAALFVGGAVAAQLVLHPSLVHYGEKNRRLQIEGEYATAVQQQPEWREGLLAEARRQIDALRVLQDVPADADRAGLGELAFAVWCRTQLAARGFSSSVEIQDATGAVVSRFALNLPSVSSGPLPLPESEAWDVEWETVRLVSAKRPARHAQRRLVYDGRLHGAVHVHAADDFWNLPFLEPRDPYPTLFRSASPRSRRDRTVHLVVYEGRAVVFTSADRPPGLSDELLRRLTATPRGFWTTLSFGPVTHHVFLFTDGRRTFGLSYPRSGPAPYAANLVEAAAATALAAAAIVLLLLAARSLLRRPTFSLQTLGGAMMGRFSARLFVAFVALAVVSVAVLQLVTRSYLVERLRQSTERQGLQRAETAQKAVEDFAYFQKGDAPGDEPVTDAALVWVASLIRNDADLFRSGAIAASSKRELYASRLLGAQVSGPVYRALILDGEPEAIRTERIGGFSYLVASVPVRLDRGEPAILSIPLALRQREVQTIVEDLDRTIRLASLLFLAGAALLAHRLARRISDPIRALTAATERIAGGDLEARVTVGSRDELRQLVESFNRMAGDLHGQRRELERSNRLAAWAEMARQVAHEVKNPLTPIQLSTQHLRRVYGDPGVDFTAALDTCTATILEQVRKLREIATEFSSFARPPAAQLNVAPLDALVREVLAPYRSSLPPTVTLDVKLDDPLPPVRVDRRLFDRALVNLVENALHAIGDSGRIDVTVRSGAGGRAEVDVADSGPGIDPAVRDRIFEPFFSTKTSGSGLGLALVKKILEDHGGGVDLQSRPGEGTHVTIWLPRDNPTAPR